MNADRVVWVLVLLAGLLTACSGDDDRVKLKAALENGPLSVSADSSGEVEFGAAEKFKVDVFDPGKGVSTAEERVEEQREKREAELKWYVVFVLKADGGKEALFEFAPEGFVQVTLEGKVVQSLRLRITETELHPGATAEITEISHLAKAGQGGPKLPDPLLPAAMVGRWTGKLSYFERRNPLGKGYTRPDRLITIVIPARKLPASGVLGTATLPRADYTVDYGDREEKVSRPAQKNVFVLASEQVRPISINRVYVRIADGKGMPFSLTILANGKLYLEQYKTIEGRENLDIADLEQAGLLTKER
jgi:hypothetical protein